MHSRTESAPAKAPNPLAPSLISIAPASQGIFPRKNIHEKQQTQFRRNGILRSLKLRSPATALTTSPCFFAPGIFRRAVRSSSGVAVQWAGGMHVIRATGSGMMGERVGLLLPGLGGRESRSGDLMQMPYCGLFLGHGKRGFRGTGVWAVSDRARDVAEQGGEMGGEGMSQSSSTVARSFRAQTCCRITRLRVSLVFICDLCECRELNFKLTATRSPVIRPATQSPTAFMNSTISLAPRQLTIQILLFHDRISN